MNVMHELRDMAEKLASVTDIPPIKDIIFPQYYEDGQPVECEFMVMLLHGGTAGVSYVLIDREHAKPYGELKPEDFIGTTPEKHLLMFGSDDLVKNMIGLAAVNSICQHIMHLSVEKLDLATDSLGLMDIQKGDRVGMVGFFRPLIKYIDKADAELVIIEKNEALLGRFKDYKITGDASELDSCNKVLCTSTTVLNNTLDDVLSHCKKAGHVTVLGPTAGYFPDPLFARGVDVVGGRYVHDGELLFERIKKGEKWGDATKKLCFQKGKYKSIINDIS
ncbi:Rossmann-like domain-containing protein [Spirochaetota bacterium]